MIRWLVEAGVLIASEKLLSKELVSTDIISEAAPFTFALKRGGEEVQASAMAYVVPSLPDKVIELLEQHARFEHEGRDNVIISIGNIYSVDQLTWHNGAIPPDEIWVKLGGDKHGGSFKMNFQICNVCIPNSKTNTCVFYRFMGYDSITNLHVGLNRYSEQVNELQAMIY